MEDNLFLECVRSSVLLFEVAADDGRPTENKVVAVAPEKRAEIRRAFLQESRVNNRISQLQFCSTTDGRGPGVHTRFPSAFEDYPPAVNPARLPTGRFVRAVKGFRPPHLLAPRLARVASALSSIRRTRAARLDVFAVRIDRKLYAFGNSSPFSRRKRAVRYSQNTDRWPLGVG